MGTWIYQAETSSAFIPFSRKPVTTLLKPLEITLAGGLRGSASFSLQIGESSTLTQEIILDATCPYLRFLTQVWPAAAMWYKRVLCRQGPGELNLASELRSSSCFLPWSPPLL